MEIGYTTNAGEDVIPNETNLLRIMNDEQLRLLFENSDVPTNEDHIAIIDSKANISTVYKKAEIDALFTSLYSTPVKEHVHDEIINARTDIKGKVHLNLKTRLDMMENNPNIIWETIEG